MGQPKIEYLVLDANELISVCTTAELEKVNEIIDRMVRKREAQGEKTVQGFIIVEADKPYAQAVAEIIQLHENEEGKDNDNGNSEQV